jgi:7,8-dihydro-6-hydroxymethylpterin-pyrophosphokinase
MFKDTYLVALKRKDQSPRIIDLDILIYLSWNP